MLLAKFLIMHACISRVNSESLLNPPGEKVVIPDLQQLQKFENMAAGCEFGQFLSKATSSCDACDTYCRDGKDSRECPEQCHAYLCEVDSKRMISELKEIQQLNERLQKNNLTLTATISEQEYQIQNLSNTNARLQKINSAQRNTISEREDQIQKLHENNAAQENTIIGLGIVIAILFSIIISCAITIPLLYCTRKHQKIPDDESTTSIYEQKTNQAQDNLANQAMEGKKPVQVMEQEGGNSNREDEEVPRKATEEKKPVQVMEQEGGNSNRENEVVQLSEQGENSNREDRVVVENVDRIDEPCANDGISKTPEIRNLRSGTSLKATNS